MIEIFRSKEHKAKDKAQRKREAERRLRQEVGLSKSQALHAVRILWEELGQ